jgi:hypothetical protein
MGRDMAEKMPARKIAIKNERIMDRNMAEINTTKRTTTTLLTFSSFMIVILRSGGWSAFDRQSKCDVFRKSDLTPKTPQGQTNS